VAKDLERDLGLPAVLAISIGAMVGSGIFILPALAMEMAGPGVVLAYFLAGLVVLPAALSKSEMATAMPEAGGTYVYIERSMGPMLGTIAGLGTWFALSFKGALALVGGAPYIAIYLDVPVEPLAIVLALVLVAVNLVGVKQTGRLQIGIVVVMLAAMVWFVLGSAGATDPVRFEGFFGDGTGGILTATGFVFVSYAGVTKIASVAEEIEDPSRNIPLGMLGSLVFTTLLYVLVVAVMLGAAPTPELAGSETPIADVAEATLAQPGLVLVVVAAILALVSTANAGLLSSSRYPFAMSRDDLVPAFFEQVSDRFNTPSTAITVTGAMLLGMIVFLPIQDIAKLGSAFQILVFVLINVAVVAFRESDAVRYEPDFRDPLYPWTQAFGAIGGLVLLTQMELLPFAGAVLIVGGSIAWYFVYARPRVRREGAARDELRRRVGRRAVEDTRAAVDEAAEADEVVVAVTEDTTIPQEAAKIRIGAAVAGARESKLTVVRFDEVPDQLPLEPAAGIQSPGDADFEARMAAFADDLDVQVEYAEIVSHDVRHAIVNYAVHHDTDLLVVEDLHVGVGSFLFGEDDEWIATHAPCDVLLVDAERVTDLAAIGLMTDRGPFDPAKVEIADAIADAAGASIVFIQRLGPDATEERRRTLEAYHAELAGLCSVPVESQFVREPDVGSLATEAAATDLVMTEGERTGLEELLGPGDLADAIDGPTVVLWPHRSDRSGPLGRVLERLTF